LIAGILLMLVAAVVVVGHVTRHIYFSEESWALLDQFRPDLAVSAKVNVLIQTATIDAAEQLTMMTLHRDALKRQVDHLRKESSCAMCGSTAIVQGYVSSPDDLN